MFKSKAASAATDTHAHKVAVDAPLIDDMIVLLDAAVDDGVKTAQSFGRIKFVLNTLKDIRARDMTKTFGFIAKDEPIDPSSIKVGLTLNPRRSPAIADIDLDIKAARLRLNSLGANPARIQSKVDEVETGLWVLELERAFAISFARSSPEAIAAAMIAKRDTRCGGTDIRYTMADGSMFEGRSEDIATLMRDLGRGGKDTV